MDESLHPAAVPKPYDRVQIHDLGSATRVAAVVERSGQEGLVLRLEQALEVSGEARLRWVDGDRAWQASTRLEQIDSVRVGCSMIPSEAWQASRARGSVRARADGSRILVRIVSSGALTGGRRVHAICLDISATGSRATWQGQAPRVGDSVELTWDAGSARGAAELGWVAARVARVVPVAPGQSEVAFNFTVTKTTQAARIHAWHQAWCQRQRSAAAS